MTEDIRKYAFIDALRGYAILLVVLVHSSQAVAPTNSTLQLLMANGARGVQLFYIASALTLCLSWQSRSPHEAFPVRNFLLRRFFRIAPMFYIAIACYLILYGFAPRFWAPDGIEWWYVPLTALFLNGFHPETITSVVPGGWSIAVEMSFYVVLPFLLRSLKTTRAYLCFFLFSLGLYVASRSAFTHLYSSHYPENQQYLVSQFTYLNFFGQLPVFATGIVAYSLFRDSGSLRRTVICGNLAYVVALGVAVAALPTSIVARVFLHHFAVGAVFALVALTLAVFPVRVLVNRPIGQIGKISFSMYLSHFAVLEIFNRLGIRNLFGTGDLQSILYFVCVVAVTASVSYVLYSTVERWGISCGKRLIERLERVAPVGVPGR